MDPLQVVGMNCIEVSFTFCRYNALAHVLSNSLYMLTHHRTISVNVTVPDVNRDIGSLSRTHQRQSK